MSRQEFIDQLKLLHYKLQELQDAQGSRAVPIRDPFRPIPGPENHDWVGVHDDFPGNCPSGPHIKPRLLPIRTDGEHPDGRIHESQQFGPEWEYWSRPYPNWNATDRTAKSYMAHIRQLFDQ